MSANPYTFDKVFRIFLVFICFSVFFVLLRQISDVLIPFVIAVLLAYLINPFVNLIQTKIPSRAGAVALTVLLLGLLTIGMFWYGLPIIAKELANMANLLTKIVSDKDLANRAIAYVPAEVWEQIRNLFTGHDIEKFRDLIKNDKFIAVIQLLAKKILPGMWSFVSGATSILLDVLGLFFIFLYLVFILMDYQHLKTYWHNLIPAPLRSVVLVFLEDFDSEMRKYFRGQATVASLVGIIFIIGFLLIDMPMAIGMGLFLGVLNMVPYLQTIGVFPALLLAVVNALEKGHSPIMASVLVVLVFAVAQIIQDAILVPRIMGKVTGLSPALILLSVSIWGKLFGMLGLVIALPMTCLCLVWYKQAISQFEDRESLI